VTAPESTVVGPVERAKEWLDRVDHASRTDDGNPWLLVSQAVWIMGELLNRVEQPDGADVDRSYRLMEKAGLTDGDLRARPGLTHAFAVLAASPHAETLIHAVQDAEVRRL
jgi:hypothetical protein